MTKKKLKLEILDSKRNVVTTHHFFYEAGQNNRLRLTITDNEYIMDKDGKLVILTQEEVKASEVWEKVIQGEAPDPPETASKSNWSDNIIGGNVVPIGEDLDTKYQYAFNKDTGETQRLFDEKTLIKSYLVSVTNDNIVNGDKGCAVFIVVSAEDLDHAKDKAMLCEEFMKHISDRKTFERKHLQVSVAQGSYVIGKVQYFSGDPRL